MPNHQFERLSSPDFPDALLPREDAKFLTADQEHERATLNKEVVRLREVATADPHNKLKTLSYVHTG